MIEVKIADCELATRVHDAIVRALVDARSALPIVTPKVVRLRTRRRLEQLGTRLEGRVAIVHVTAIGARRLPDLVEAIRAARPSGVQLVWNGVDPKRADVERHVFAVLERARATPAGPPVVLARTEAVEEALAILIAKREKERCS